MAVNAVNGIAATSSSTIMGIANPSAILGQTLSAGGGGASAFVLVQSKTALNDSGAVTTVTMDSNITAGNLIVVNGKCEDDEVMTAFTENGVAGTIPAAATVNQSDLDLAGGYKLVATGGGTSIGVTFSGTPLFSRVIVREYSYGGTASFVVANSGSGADNPQGSGDGATIETADVTNSGTHRLNVACAGLYSSTAPTSPRIGGAAGSNFITQSDTHMWDTTGSLAGGVGDDADCQYSIDGKWTMNIMCFAAN